MKLIYFKRDKFISALEKHFPDILQEIPNCDHQRYDSEQGHGQSIPTGSTDIKTTFKHGPTDRELEND